MAPKLKLTEQEEQVRQVLVDAAHSIEEESAKKGERIHLTLRFAGGWVRDKILDIPCHDVDVAIDKMTGLDFATQLSEFLKEHINKYNIPSRSVQKVERNPNKSKHLETAMTKIMDIDLDFVNLRSETYSEDSRIPQMEFGTPEEDALRRDATINALFYNLQTQEVEDLTHRGLDDMQSQLIRTPLAPYETFKDDPLRVLRLIRFASRLNFEIVDEVKEAMKNDDIKAALKLKISRERVGVEMEKMLQGPNAHESLLLVDKFNLYECIFVPDESAKISGGESQSNVFLPAIKITRWILHESKDTTPLLYQLLSDTRDKYLAWLCASSSAWRDILITEKKKTYPAAAVSIRDGLKSRSKDFDVLVDAYNNASYIDELVQRNDNEELSRLELGLCIRKLGAEWNKQVFTSLLLRLLSFWKPEEHQPNDLSMSALKQWEKFLVSLDKEDLRSAWNFKPLINGKELSALLGTKSGTWMKAALDDIMAWQLQNPKGTKDEAIHYANEQKEEYISS